MDYLATAEKTTSAEESMPQWNKSYVHVRSRFIYSVLVFNFSCNTYKSIKNTG
jgi:hypothetical protein